MAKDTGSKQLQCWAKILALFIHADMHDFEFLETNLPSTESFLNKNNPNSSYQKILLSLLKKITKDPASLEQDNTLAGAHEKMQILFESQTESSSFQYFNGLRWIESKMKNSTMAGIETAIRQI